MKKEYFYAGISIFFWSTVAVVTKFILKYINNLQLLWASMFFSTIFLLIINVATGRIKKLKNYKLKDVLISILIGLPGTFFYYVFYYAGADMLLASQAFIINYSWPIMSVIFGCIILKEKMTIKKTIAIIFSFIGVIIVMSGDIAELNKNFVYGAFLCILGAVSYGLFTALNQKRNYDKAISMMINYFVSFFLTTIINGIKGDLFFPGATMTLGFIWNGVFSIAVASTLWLVALESGKTAKISNLAYITPFLSLVWTAIFLKEPLNINSIIGLTVIIAGILIQLKKTNKSR